jgi:hypothetical protein
VGKINSREESKVRPVNRVEQYSSNIYVTVLYINVVYRSVMPFTESTLSLGHVQCSVVLPAHILLFIEM